jgi:GH15 family glucan-1,4-alpha-glucosidase
VARGALPSGALPEQLDPVTGEPAGATPLTWVHGTFILTVLEYINASSRLGGAAPA